MKNNEASIFLIFLFLITYTEAMDVYFAKKALCHVPAVACFLAKAASSHAPILSTVPFLLNGPSVLTQGLMLSVNVVAHFNAHFLINETKDMNNAALKIKQLLGDEQTNFLLKNIHYISNDEPQKAVFMVSARYVLPFLTMSLLYSVQTVALWYQKRFSLKNVAIAVLYSGMYVGPWKMLIQFQE